ncbi:MAG TPA: CoA transferase [Solirubrobacteraceae bacterium]|jgi:formyl-CoA transferase|nr:CoA transferase [Solirubrobacteraceae bacterium]
MPDEINDKPALHGITVIDLSRVLAGPYATMLLADLGADVIKIERPGGGDDTRSWGPPFVGTSDEQESTYFLSINRSKRSLICDFKDPGDLEVLRALIAEADVLVENFRHGVMDRLGIGHERLLESNPRLVILSITGFGSSGPDADRVGYDQIVQAEGGLMSVTGLDQSPVKVGVPIADLMAGTYGTLGVLAALRARDEDGLGQVVSTSLLAGQIGIHCFQGTRWLVAGEVPGPAGNQHPTVCPYGTFQTATAPVVIAVGNDAIWCRFAPLIEINPDEARFATNPDRVEHRHELESLITDVFSRRPAEDWLATLALASVPAGEVRTLDRVYEWEQVRDQGLVMRVDHPTLGTIELPGNPLHFSRSPVPEPTAPPTLGQHTEAILAERRPGITR